VVEIKYRENLEVLDIAGRTVAEARDLFKKDREIAGKVSAYLNGKRVLPDKEAAIILNDEDTVEFKISRNKTMYMLGAMLLALAVTGGVFAYGFINATTTLNAATVASDFASVSANTSDTPSWTVHGQQKSPTGSGTLFDINTLGSGYEGDFTVTVTLANTDSLISIYRNLNLSLEVRDSAGSLININGDSAANGNDFVMLTLENGAVTFSIEQAAADIYTIKRKIRYYFINAANAGWGSGAPQLYCEVAQR